MFTADGRDKREPDLFGEYRKDADPAKRERAAIWRTAIGLQSVDGLKTSGYLISLARKNIEGEIGTDEVCRLIDAHYSH